MREPLAFQAKRRDGGLAGVRAKRERPMNTGKVVPQVLAACLSLFGSGCDSTLPAHVSVGQPGRRGTAVFSWALPGASWVLPEARSKNLLYVSGNSGYVYIFSFPTGKLVGTLTGFQEVTGVCTDAAGNVWVANSADFDLVEYAHGGTVPIATLTDYQSYPFSCSVNRRNGDLAVSNIFSIGQGQTGGIAVYRAAAGTPKVFSDSKFAEYYFVGYGPKGESTSTGWGRAPTSRWRDSTEADSRRS